MDSHGDRSRLLRSGLDGGSGGSSGGSGSSGGRPTSVSDYPGRAATPTTLTLAQYHSRFGLPSAMPGSNLAVMSSLLSGAHNPEARKAMLIDFQQYWSAQADNFPRYLMTGGIFPSYPPLLPGAAESLSLLGAGVACVAGGASAAGQAHSQHVAHYQRLLEMQKEAYLASMSVAANHHSALYGITTSALPPFMEHSPYTSHGASPFSLVKQEPRELSCTEKTAKQGERRATGFKVDLDLNRGNKEFLSSSSSSSLANTHNTQVKEPKLSPSTSNGSSAKFDKKGNSSSTLAGSSNGHQSVKKLANQSAVNSSSAQRHNLDNARSKCVSPSTKSTPKASASHSTKIATNSSGSKKSGSRSSLTASKHIRTVASGHTASTSRPSPSAFVESPIVSVPTQIASPIPLATVQHDGVFLSALASPSSAAASLASIKPAVIKLHTDKLTRASNGDSELTDVAKSAPEASTSSRLSDQQNGGSLNHEHNTQTISDDRRDLDTSNNGVNSKDQDDDSRALSDDSSDIVVDSTENDDFPALDASSTLPRSNQERTIEDTIQKVASAAESDIEDATPVNSTKTSPDASSTTSGPSVARIEVSSVSTSSGASFCMRTINAKTQCIPSVTASGCVQMTSSITTQASTSALPYYHTLYSKPQGVRRVHATTFVPEVGVFKGPSIKTMTKSSSSPSSSGNSALSPDNRYRLEARSASNIFSFAFDGNSRARDSTPSPSLLSPPRDVVSHSAYSSPSSPGIAHTTTEISSSLDTTSLDSASIRSQSVASFHSVPDVGDSDDASDDNENGLVIDHETYDNSHTNDEAFIKSKKNDSHQDQNLPGSLSDTIQATVNNDKLTVKNEEGEEEECLDSASTSHGKSKEDLTSEKGSLNNVIATCDLPVPVIPSNKSLGSKVCSVPSEMSAKTCCEVAIDYSLPKSSCSRSRICSTQTSCDRRVSNSTMSTSATSDKGLRIDSSHQQSNSVLTAVMEIDQTQQKKNINLSNTSSGNSVHCHAGPSVKQISSLAKPLFRQDIAGSSVSKSLLKASSPHKRLKPAPDHTKTQAFTPASQDNLSRVTRRLGLLEDDSPQRCGSAPPITSSSLFKPLKSGLLLTSDSLHERGLDSQDKLESSGDHCPGNNIPIGIAVAQIRPHHVQQPRDSQTSESLNRENRHVHTTTSSKNLTQTTTSMATSAAALAPALVVAGSSVNPSPWLQQMPFPIHQAVNSSGTTFDPSYPITAPRGFKFVHDSLTGRFFIVPTGDFVEQGGVWPAPASFVPPSGAGTTHYQANVNLPTITISGPEGRDGLSSRENKTGKSLASENTRDIIIPEPDRSGLARGGEKHQTIAQQNLSHNSNSSPTIAVITANTAATVVVNPVSNIPAESSSLLFKEERPTVESRGCSPIFFEDTSSPLSLLSTLSSLTSKKVTTCTIGIQTCDDLVKPNKKRKSSPTKLLSYDQSVQTTSPELSKLKPLSVQCPDLDSVDTLTPSLNDKTNPVRVSYNPFTDPQILQAADGLELLSTLAEKRTKCSSLDDPKRIFPSPSDSFKSDSASLVAIEDTLSPGDTELKSGQCTPRREFRRDLSPKWSLPKKESQTVSVFADFKAPPEVDMPEDSDVRVKLAEVQRQYKEKQKELAKLQIKKSDDSKPSKRGPGRPPKKKSHSKKSDDESSGSSPKVKDHHQPHKKKRPAEELVDRVFRKLPPVIKPGKVSRSIHYVKSKTGPFFRRKSASSSVKRNKDLFGFDESNWPSFSERKYQEKIKGTGGFSGRSESRHRSGSSQSEDGKHGHTVGNIFDNLESFDGDYVRRRERALKHHSRKHRKALSGSGTVSIKTETCSISSHQESGLGLLAKFALTVSTTSLSSPSVSLPLSSLTTSCTSSTATSGNISSFSSGTFNTCISSSAIYCSNLYNTCSNIYNMSNSGNGSQAPSITFGSLSSLMSSSTSGLMSFSSPGLAASNLNSNTPTTTSVSVFSSAASLASSMNSSPTTTSSSCIALASPLFPSPGAHNTSLGESSSGTTSSSGGSTNFSIMSNSATNSHRGNVRDISPFKRRHEEDSDTDTSDTSPNKKRKPGRPRKINPEKSSGGTETIWAKKSSNIGLLQVSEPSCSQAKDGPGRKLEPLAMTPLFLDEEWTRRRSERIFLNEPSPLPSPALSPSPRGEPVWKLSHFMPKSKKIQDTNKPNKEGDKDKSKTDYAKDQSPSFSSGLLKASTFSSPPVSTSVTVKVENKDHWASSAKTADISIPRVEDAKVIVKLEVPNSSPSSISNSTTFSSPKKVKNGHQENGPSKKKKAKKTVESTEVSLAVSSSSLSQPPPIMEKKEKRAEEHSKIKLQKAKSLHDLTQRVKKKYSKTGMRKQRDEQPKKDSRMNKKKRKISTDSSDNDSLPLVSYREDSPTPEPRSCKLQPSDLREGLKVLYLIDGLFHEGSVKALQPPDVYGVLTAGQRGNRPHILCLEEILKWAVLDVKPGSVRYLPEGTRVCAFWSQQFSCLYPGTVAKSSPVYNGKKVVIPVDFDDGDNGRIELDHIRLLPSDFSIVEYEADPLEVLPKRKQRTMSESSDSRKATEKESRTNKHSKTEEDNDSGGSKTDSDDSGSSGNMVRPQPWRWDGKCTKKPGMKGKAKKVFYRAVTRGKETIKIGDSAMFVSKDRAHCPYIGRVESLWEGWNGQMMVKVFWYYHPEETESDKKLSDPRNALFESQHEDENDIQTIACKCEVMPYTNYKKLLNDATKRGETLKHVFYLAGFYDPTARNITFYQGVS